MKRSLKWLAILVAAYLLYRILSDYLQPVTVILEDDLAADLPVYEPPEPPGRERSAMADNEQERVKLNEAGINALTALPGIGPALAHRIVTHRQHVGPFQSVEDLVRVQGIGTALVERLRPFISID
jgi:competence protein ComEA